MSWALLLLDTVLLVAMATLGVTEDNDDDGPTTSIDGGFTFRTPGKSYVEYAPEFELGNSWRLELEFRTQKANTFLVHHMLSVVGEHPALLQEVWIKLRKGHLDVSHDIDGQIEQVALGRGQYILCYISKFLFDDATK